ncbi:MAG: TetR family transcriptional regulator, partial [Acidimicrobiales bacterium]
AAAGVSVRSVYRHFGSRDELLLALFEEEARTGAALLRARLDKVDGPLERLQAFVEGLASLMVAGSGYATLLVQEHLRLAGSHPTELVAALSPLVDLLDAELRAAAAAGELRPVDGVDVATVFALLLTQVQTVALLEPSATTASAAARLWRFCRAALAPDPTRGTR